MPKHAKISEAQLRELATRMNTPQICTYLGVGKSVIRRRLAKWGIKITAPRAPISKHTRALLSKAKREWCIANPERHPWKRASKSKSAPCEKLKEWLRSRGVVFLEEFTPLMKEQRSYAIDIALPDKYIGIEVNGNQHYQSDGSLKPYYQKRHDQIEAEGWKLYELHFSICYQMDELERIIPALLDSPIKATFDYEFYIRDKNTPKPRVSDMDPNWRKKPRFDARKVQHPSKEELQRLIWEVPTQRLAIRFGVSSNAIAAWCRRLGLTKPPRGYWAKMKAAKAD